MVNPRMPHNARLSLMFDPTLISIVGSPEKSQLALICRQTVAYLGSVALEEEEVNLLACHVVNQSIVYFVKFLGDMCDMLQQSQGGATDIKEMAEIHDKIRSYVQVILRCIARFRTT